MLSYRDYPPTVAEDIVRLRRRIAASGLPDKHVDANLLVGTWNIRTFGGVHQAWAENPNSPKRNLRALAYIAEIIKRFDVVAIQEVRRNTTGLRRLLRDFLGSDWGVLLSDVTAGTAGNVERLAFVYDKRRVQPSGLVGQIVLPPTSAGQPSTQFARPPYLVGFQAKDQRFVLVTVHVKYGSHPDERLDEIQALSRYVAEELQARITADSEETGIIVLGDFNIDKRGDNPLFRALIATGLIVPAALMNLKSTYGTEPKYYDHIAWFMGALELGYAGRAGSIDFSGAVFQELSLQQMSYRVSDHFPLWVEFIVDHSAETLAETLGLEPAAPDPLAEVPD